MSLIWLICGFLTGVVSSFFAVVFVTMERVGREKRAPRATRVSARIVLIALWVFACSLMLLLGWLIANAVY